MTQTTTVTHCSHMKAAWHSLDYRRYREKLRVFYALCVWGIGGIQLCGQGTVNFSNQLVPPGIINSLTGQRAEAGTIFSVGLYFAPDGVTDELQFTEIGNPVNIGVFGGMIMPEFGGYFSGGIRTAPLCPPGGFGMFQVRAWETSFGSTYEESLSNPNPQNGRLALVGKSGIMRVDTGDPTVQANLPTSLVSPDPFRVMAVVGAPLRDGFSLTVVPEPAAPLLLFFGLLGLSFFWVLRRGYRRP